MLYIFLSIISSSLIYVLFKYASHVNVKIFPAIVINYLTAAIIGFTISNHQFNIDNIINANWFYVSIVLGILFIIMFYIIGLSTNLAGISITSLSTKMSVVFPILFSIVYYKESINAYKISGMILAVSAIILASIKGENAHLKTGKLHYPLLLFIGMGIVDSLVKFNQEEYLKNAGIVESSTVCFAAAFIVGAVFYFLKSRTNSFKISLKTILIGIALGITNFGSLYFLIAALNSKFAESSIIFALNNTIVIAFTILVGKFIFKEKLILINWIGIGISIIAIVSLSI